MNITLLVKSTLAIAALGLIYTGYQGADIQNQTHPKNPGWLEGSPLGRTIARLTQRTVNQNWENGEDSRPPVYTTIYKEPLFGDSLNPVKRVGYLFDILSFERNRRSYQPKNMEALDAKIKNDLRKGLESSFRMDSTSGPALQILLFYYTELDHPQYDTPEQRVQRLAKINGYIDTALASYNLDIPEGNPDHHVAAAEIEMSRFNIRTLLDPAFDPADPKSPAVKEALKKELALKMEKHLNDALTCQEWHQDKGTWDKRSPYRKQDFWESYYFNATLAHSAGAPQPKSRTHILEDRYKVKFGEWAEGDVLYEKYTQQAFGKPGEAGHSHEGHSHGDHSGHDHGDHEGHDHSEDEGADHHDEEHEDHEGHEGHKH